ncbi:MAG: porin family protein, partial [Chitinophagaceae bacterium]
AKAQDATGASFGVKAGLNIANIKATGDDDENNGDARIAYHGGVFANIPFGMLSFQPELVYSAEGTKDEFDGDNYKLKLNYLNIPLMLQYNTAGGFYAETGPQIGFLLSAKTEVETSGDEVEEDVKDQFKSTNFSWGLGVGFKMSSGMGIGARYNFGLSDIADVNDVDDDFKLKSNVIQIGISFPIGGGAR